MHKHRNSKWGLAALFLFMSSQGQAACLQVASIGKVQNLENIRIERAQGANEWAIPAQRRLCAGDKVFVPEKFDQPVKVIYYSENQKEVPVAPGDQYEVVELEAPCGIWCKLTEKTLKLWTKLTQESPKKSGIVSGKGPGESCELSTKLAAGEGDDYPFYLFSHSAEVPLFWQGRQLPYAVEVENVQGEMVFKTQVTESTGKIIFPEAEPQQEYDLTVTTKACKPYRKRIVFTVPPFPLDPTEEPFKLFTRLLKDPERNWRLEIWRQLQQLPASPEQKNFADRLMADDFIVEKELAK